MSAVRTGLERIARGDERSLVSNRRIGLVAHPASVTAELVHAADVLRAAGARIEALFGPEHGYGGEAQDMIGVADAVDRDGTPIRSLYGPTFEDLSPKEEWLAGLDALVIDLEDVGSRYYTFVWTAVLCLERAAEAGVHTIVLDRPNPLGGVRLEGAPQRPEFRSFVGLHSLPVRHGMTIGEVVALCAKERAIAPEALSIVAMQGWDPHADWHSTKLPWVTPSPNMPTVETAKVYPGGCLLEGTNLSEGRGTTRPFELFGAPWLDGSRLAAALELQGATLRPTTFLPMFQKHAGNVCGGVQVHVTDETRFSAYESYVRCIAEVARQHRDHFRFRTERYEYVDDVPAFDLLTGDRALRTAIEGGEDVEPILAEERIALARWDSEHRERFLYPR